MSWGHEWAPFDATGDREVLPHKAKVWKCSKCQARIKDKRRPKRDDLRFEPCATRMVREVQES
jgi:hypothetical protein